MTELLDEISRPVVKLPKEHPFPKSPYSLGWLYNAWQAKHGEDAHAKPTAVPLDRVRKTEDTSRNVMHNNRVHLDPNRPGQFVDGKSQFSLFPQHRRFPVVAKIGDDYHIMEGHHRSSIRQVAGKKHMLAHVYELDHRDVSTHRIMWNLAKRVIGLGRGHSPSIRQPQGA